MEGAELLEGLGVCVHFLCKRLEEVEEAARSGEVSLTETGLRNLIQIGRDLVAAMEAIGETTPPQDMVVRFTNSDCEPQDI